MKSADIVGKKYGRWTVLEYAGKDNQRCSIYKCRCDCGAERNVLERSLKSGNSKSCGCYKRDRLSSQTGRKHPNFRDIQGQRFGRLVAVEYTGNYINGAGTVWKCQCDCGNVVFIPLSSLKSGRTRSCGCLAKEIRSEKGRNAKDIAGERFGRLIAIEPTNKRRGDSCVLWKCKCDCGNTVEVASSNLLRGVTNSCGCLRDENRIASLKTDEFREKQREKSIETWDESAKAIGMQDDTNVSLVKKNRERFSSGEIKGCFEKRPGYWVARIQFQKQVHIEYGFHSMEEARKAYDRMYGEYVEPYIEAETHA